MARARNLAALADTVASNRRLAALDRWGQRQNDSLVLLIFGWFAISLGPGLVAVKWLSDATPVPALVRVLCWFLLLIAVLGFVPGGIGVWRRIRR